MTKYEAPVPMYPTLNYGPRGGINRKEKRTYVKRIDEIRELLKEFGWTPYGYDPGVSIQFEIKGRMAHTQFDSDQFAAIYPLLLELRDLRAKNKRRALWS